jgi:hypothetical protein
MRTLQRGPAAWVKRYRAIFMGLLALAAVMCIYAFFGVTSSFPLKHLPHRIGTAIGMILWHLID